MLKFGIWGNLLDVQIQNINQRPQTFLLCFDFQRGSVSILHFACWLALGFQLQSDFLSVFPISFIPGSLSSQLWITERYARMVLLSCWRGIDIY